MSTWVHIAEWAEFHAQQLREQADKAEKLVNNEPSFAFAASLRKAAEVMEKDAKQWRFNVTGKPE